MPAPKQESQLTLFKVITDFENRHKYSDSDEAKCSICGIVATAADMVLKDEHHEDWTEMHVVCKVDCDYWGPIPF